MKMITKCVLSLGMLMGSVAYSAQPATPLLQPVDEAYPNSVYFGPEVFGYQLKTEFKGTLDKNGNEVDPTVATVKGTRFYAGGRLGYQYLTPDSFYAGIEVGHSVSSVDLKAFGPFNETTKKAEAITFTKGDKFLATAEGRIGYSFSPDEWMVTPYAGVGIRYLGNLDSHNSDGYKSRLPYAAVGAISEYVLCPSTKIGVNLKVLHTFNAYQRFKITTPVAGAKPTVTIDSSDRNMWGAEIGVPVSWQFGDTKRWDVKVEPYFLKLDFSKTQNVYGTNFLFGYRF